MEQKNQFLYKNSKFKSKNESIYKNESFQVFNLKIHIFVNQQASGTRWQFIDRRGFLHLLFKNTSKNRK